MGCGAGMGAGGAGAGAGGSAGVSFCASASSAFLSKSWAMLLLGEAVRTSSQPCFTRSNSPFTNQPCICLSAFSRASDILFLLGVFIK